MCRFVYKYLVWCAVVMICEVQCNPVMTNLNTSLREFATPEDSTNSTNVRTLQKEEFARYASIAPVQSPVRFKEISDNTLSSSTYQGRGLVHHEHNGYGLDYDDLNQHYGQGHGDYHLHDTGHGLPDHHLVGHGLGHQLYGLQGHHIGHGLQGHHHDDHGHHETHVYHGDHIHGHGHHHKHLAHALAAKTIFWPIAGIALLGAAAALVSNPVLLQLGVVSGRRKRETQETQDYDPDILKKWLTTNPLVMTTKTRANTERRVTEASSFKLSKPVDNFEKLTQDHISIYKRDNVVERKDDILKRYRRNRLLNVNKRMVLRNPTNTVYVNQSDLPRTQTDQNKHYIPVPLLTNS